MKKDRYASPEFDAGDRSFTGQFLFDLKKTSPLKWMVYIVLSGVVGLSILYHVFLSDIVLETRQKKYRQLQECFMTMNRISTYKRFYATEHRAIDGAAISRRDLTGNGEILPCPSEGRYEIGRVGASPSCSVHGPMDAMIAE